MSKKPKALTNPYEEGFVIKRLLFDKKRHSEKTPTKGLKIFPTIQFYRNSSKKIEIYSIHHLDAENDEFLPIRHIA